MAQEGTHGEPLWSNEAADDYWQHRGRAWPSLLRWARGYYHHFRRMRMRRLLHGVGMLFLVTFAGAQAVLDATAARSLEDVHVAKWGLAILVACVSVPNVLEAAQTLMGKETDEGFELERRRKLSRLLRELGIKDPSVLDGQGAQGQRYPMLQRILESVKLDVVEVAGVARQDVSVAYLPLARSDGGWEMAVLERAEEVDELGRREGTREVGRWFCAEAVRARPRLVVLHDLKRDHRAREAWEFEDGKPYRSIASFPVVGNGGQPIGVISIDCTKPYAFWPGAVRSVEKRTSFYAKFLRLFVPPQNGEEAKDADNV